ncbi:MAG TPA: DUF5723 family protein [Bacteroidia bacterium]|nr:DUF5723 family protein [Bacteroidia bacterium]
MKHLLTTFLMLGCGLSSFAQIDMGIPTATGKGGVATAMVLNYECVGINPSNLGWRDNYRFSFTVANVGIAAQSRAIDFATLKDAMLHPGDTFTQAQKDDYATRFATPDGFNFNANVTWFAASLYFPKFGGIGVNVRDRAFSHVTLSPNAADLMFNGFNSAGYQDSSAYGQNMSSFLDGTRLTMLHYREVNIAYGRKIFGLGTKDDDGKQAIEFFGGFGFKFIWGLGNLDAKIGDGTLSGHSSMTTNYEIQYGNIQNFSPEKSPAIFNSVGQGTAIDFGFSVVINEKIRAAISFTDMGQINWNENLLVASDTLMPSFDSTETGINSWDMNSQASYFMNDFMNYESGEGYTTKLPGRMRIGYGMKIGERINLGADIVVPLNKSLYNLSSPYFAIGAEFKIAEIFRVHTGFAGNPDFGWNVPLGITLGPLGFFEIGLATGDILTYFAKTDNPNLSLAVGVIRFNFKAKED